jgi:hypothetical protein
MALKSKKKTKPRVNQGFIKNVFCCRISQRLYCIKTRGCSAFQSNLTVLTHTLGDLLLCYYMELHSRAGLEPAPPSSTGHK